jgi:hypothetical protein
MAAYGLPPHLLALLEKAAAAKICSSVRSLIAVMDPVPLRIAQVSRAVTRRVESPLMVNHSNWLEDFYPVYLHVRSEHERVLIHVLGRACICIARINSNGQLKFLIVLGCQILRGLLMGLCLYV